MSFLKLGVSGVDSIATEMISESSYVVFVRSIHSWDSILTICLQFMLSISLTDKSKDWLLLILLQSMNLVLFLLGPVSPFQMSNERSLSCGLWMLSMTAPI